MYLASVFYLSSNLDQTCERFMASLAQLSTSLWKSSVKVPFLWLGTDKLDARYWEPDWLWPKPPDPLMALVLLVPVRTDKSRKTSDVRYFSKLQHQTKLCHMTMNEDVSSVLSIREGCYMSLVRADFGADEQIKFCRLIFITGVIVTINIHSKPSKRDTVKYCYMCATV